MSFVLTCIVVGYALYRTSQDADPLFAIFLLYMSLNNLFQFFAI